jgi:prephenate dehydratase
MVKRIVIQGGYGAFHEIAAMHYFENQEIEILPRNTFKDVVLSLKKNNVDYGIMAIENSIAGSILPNYNLLRESDMRIVGEIYLRIKQNLVALPGQTIEDIREVYSHPMAILQCQSFFDRYQNIRLVESMDTALSAKELKDKRLKGVGAIIAEGIETNKMNYTRFLILGENNHNNILKDGFNKASVCFALAHQIGCLSKVLSILSYYNINLTKIQSMPIIGKDWEYQFHVDLEFSDLNLYRQSLTAIGPFTSDLGILGEYMKGKSII